MSRIYLSQYAFPETAEYLRSCGHEIIYVCDTPLLGYGVGSHPDLHMCRMGGSTSSDVLFADERDFSPLYPGNAKYCAAVLDKYIIHRLDITAKPLLDYAEKHGLNAINVRQGYTKCSCAVVDGSSIITADRGIISALKPYDDIIILEISPNGVLLPGFNRGFIGGACGRVGDEMIFNGDITRHPDFERIRDFILERGLTIKYTLNRELTDIGSIIELT